MLGIIRTLCLAILLCSCVAPSVLASGSLANLEDLRPIQRRLTTIYIDTYHPAIRREVELIRRKLKAAPVAQRPRVLQTLAEQTRWGTPERATARYVCARYGVDYERSRDYLLNAFFWYGYRLHPPKPAPFSWAEDTVYLLYDLYERNHDFRLLHDLVTGDADAAGGEAIDDVRTRALQEHPRGMLHVAAMSGQARGLAESVLSGEYRSGADGETNNRVMRIFRAYVRRVSADPKDPLYATARRLLRHAATKRASPRG